MDEKFKSECEEIDNLANENKEKLFEEVERTMREMEEYYKERRRCQEFLLPYLLELGKENIKRVTAKDKKGRILWDFHSEKY